MATKNESGDHFEARLRALEDELEIHRLIASYGPLIEAGNRDVAERVFAEDARLEAGGSASYNGIGELLYEENVVAGRAKGAAHAMSFPVVKIVGDSATAICHGFLLYSAAEGFLVSRAASIAWKLERRDGVWRITYRNTHLLNGSPDALEQFEEGLLKVWG